MNKFLNELAKTVFYVIAIIGILLIAVGIVLFVYPEVLRWGIVLTSILIGVYFFGCGLCGIIKAKMP